jgi:hypothetical protein
MVPGLKAVGNRPRMKACDLKKIFILSHLSLFLKLDNPQPATFKGTSNNSKFVTPARIKYGVNSGGGSIMLKAYGFLPRLRRGELSQE